MGSVPTSLSSLWGARPSGRVRLLRPVRPLAGGRRPPVNRGMTFEQFAEGAEFVSAARTVTEADVVAFAGLSGDFNPLHTDAAFAAATPFGQRIAHGMLIAAMATGMANWTGIF